MRGLLLALAVILSGAVATPSEAQDKNAIQETIQSQMDAFRVDDFEGAFAVASPFIQGMFGDADRFGMMVQRGYPMVWRNETVRYLELRDVAGRLWQKVMIQDTSGSLHILDYEMIETENGWQINGVQLLPKPDVGA